MSLYELWEWGEELQLERLLEVSLIKVPAASRVFNILRFKMTENNLIKAHLTGFVKAILQCGDTEYTRPRGCWSVPISMLQPSRLN